MDDILNDTPDTQPFEIGELVDTQPTETNVPESAIRNRAATSAILAEDPSQLINKYRLIMEEGRQGRSDTHDSIMDSVAMRNRSTGMQSVINILADPNIPVEKKKEVMKVVQTGNFKEEPAITLQTNALQNPSKGEDQRGEAARISLAETMGAMNKEAQERQKILNNFIATHPDPGMKTVPEVAADVLPFGNSIITAKVSAKFDELMGTPHGFFTWMKDLLTPGSTKQELRQRLERIPVAKRAEVQEKLRDAIKSSASIFPSENHYQQYQMATRMLEDEGYSNTDKWVDNVANVLDAVWVTSGVRGLAKAGKAAKEVSPIADVAAQAKYTPPTATAPARDALDEIIARQSKLPMPAPEAAVANKRIAALEDERASLLGIAGNLAEKGNIRSMGAEIDAIKPPALDKKSLTKEYQSQGMGFKDAQANAQKDIDNAMAEYESRTQHLTNQINTNTDAANAIRRIDEIDKEIQSLRKVAAPSPGIKKRNLVEEAYQHTKLNSVVRMENPVAPFNVVEQANPEAARALFKQIVEGPEEFAEAVTGVSKTQAIANSLYPQVGIEGGSVLNKVDQTVVDQLHNTGATRYTEKEAQSAFLKVKNDFRNANGLQINDAMTTIRLDGDHIVVDGHYSTPGGSFHTPEQAREQAKLALRDYGLRDDELVVMKRDGMSYRPLEAGEGGSGDYMVKISTRQPITDDLVDWNPLSVKRNWFDRNPFSMSDKKGSVSRWLFDPASMLDPVITGSASIADDQAIVLENILLKPIREFRTLTERLTDARKAMMESYIKEANTKGIKLVEDDLRARGFDDNEIKALKKWRDIWDTHFYLENYDLVRTLIGQGYQVFDSNGTKLFAKSVSKNQNIGAVLDPVTGSIKRMDKAEMDALYNSGGTYAKLRRPVNINGHEVDHMIVRNTPSEYLRRIRDTDQILNYRDGYYTVHYKKGSKFVDAIEADGTRRTVAVAGNSKDAEAFAKAQEASTGIPHRIREDSRGFTKDGDGYWDVQQSRGRIAQRIRGQELVSADGINNLGEGIFIENPMESATRAARSLAGRTVTRPVLETAKARFMDQYKELLPSNGMGGVRFPTSLSEIVDHVNHTSKQVSDARTTFEYIKYLEDGYINTADRWFKTGMNAVANMLKDVPAAEKFFLNAGQKSVTHASKSLVFNSYIVGSNFVRQWIVQSHQATRMAAYNPVGMLQGTVQKRLVGYLGDLTGFGVSKDTKDFIKFVDESGMVAGVDRNSLVRGLGLEIADSSNGFLKGAEKVRSLAQTVGFDAGEKMNQLGHLAAVYDKWLREGKDLSNKTIRDMALTEARALSYNLNRAGELAYTQSSPAMILQFLQMPHKAMLQLTNRQLPLAVRTRLAAWDLAMFGVGTGVAAGTTSFIKKMVTGDDNILPDDPEHREMFLYGMESYALNKFFSMMDDSGENTRIDFSALEPNSMDGWAKMFHTLVGNGAFAAFAASPVGQMFAVDGVNGSKRMGRIPQAVVTLGRFMNEKLFDATPIDNPTEFTAVLNDVAKISSGWTSWQNAKLMLETRKKLDSAGIEIDSHVTIPEAWSAAFGFGTKSTKELYELQQNRSTDKKAHEEMVMRQYRDILRYAKDNIHENSNGDVVHSQMVISMLLKGFDHDDLQNIIYPQWKRDMAGKEIGLTRQMIRAADLPDSSRMEDDIKMWNGTPEEKQLLLQRMKDMRDLRKQIKEQK